MILIISLNKHAFLEFLCYKIRIQNYLCISYVVVHNFFEICLTDSVWPKISWIFWSPILIAFPCLMLFILIFRSHEIQIHQYIFVMYICKWWFLNLTFQFSIHNLKINKRYILQLLPSYPFYSVFFYIKSFPSRPLFPLWNKCNKFNSLLMGPIVYTYFCINEKLTLSLSIDHTLKK